MWHRVLPVLLASEFSRGAGSARIRRRVRTLQPAIDCSAYSTASTTCKGGSFDSEWENLRNTYTSVKCMSRCAQEAELSQSERCCVFVEGNSLGFIMANKGGIRDSRSSDPHIGTTTICSPPSLPSPKDAEPTEVTPFPRGTKVLYHSSSGDWINAGVEDFIDGYYILDVKPRADVGRVRLPDGTEVEYLSKSRGRWMRAVVEGFNDGLYMLDVKHYVDPVEVRLPILESPKLEFGDKEANNASNNFIYVPHYIPLLKDEAYFPLATLSASAVVVKYARADEGEVGRCSRYKSATETCKSGSTSENWVSLWDDADRNRCAERCRMLAVRTNSEICCTVGADGCWGMSNRGGVRASRDDDPHIGSTLVCAPPFQSVESLSGSHARWADVRDDNFLSNDAMVRGGKFLQDMFADISPRNLRQGSLGNCWLIASIASFAIYPIAVRSIFTQQFANWKGEYAAQLWHPEKTKWVRLTIDDKVPAQSWTREQPKYITASDAGGFWPLLMEKAFAKMLGGYKELEGHGGYTAVAYAALSGSSPNYMYEWLESENEWAKRECTGLGNKEFVGRVHRNQMWDLLYDSYNGNKLLGGSCCKEGVLLDVDGATGYSGEVSKDNGLYDNHGYSILAVKYIEPGRQVKYCVNDETNQVVNDVLCRGAGDGSYEERKKLIASITEPLRLVQVRNPWGNEQKFTGQWSYADQKTWSQHPDIRSIVDYRDEDDGTWWMTFEELEHTFRKIYVGSQDMIAFDPPPPECNIGYGAIEFAGVRITWREGIRASQCAFCKRAVLGDTDCDGIGTSRKGQFCCRLINAKLRGTVRR